MKITIDNKEIQLVKSNGSWLTKIDSNTKIIKRDFETAIVIQDSSVISIKSLGIDVENKTITILHNGKKLNFKIIEPLDELLKSMGLESAFVSKISELKAPMPGLVIDVLMKEGDEIKKGDKLVVLEAMKMENILKSPVDGKIKSISILKGQAVDKNQLLISFE
jgi:biotin carboxyl carrier protein